MPAQGSVNHSTSDEAFHLPYLLSSLSSKICNKCDQSFINPFNPEWKLDTWRPPALILSSIVFPGKCFTLFVTRAQYSNKLLKLNLFLRIPETILTFKAKKELLSMLLTFLLRIGKFVSLLVWLELMFGAFYKMKICCYCLIVCSCANTLHTVQAAGLSYLRILICCKRCKLLIEQVSKFSSISQKNC